MENAPVPLTVLGWLRIDSAYVLADISAVLELYSEGKVLVVALYSEGKVLVLVVCLKYVGSMGGGCFEYPRGAGDGEGKARGPSGLYEYASSPIGSKLP